MPLISTWLAVENLTDVGYTLFDKNGIGSIRVTSGIIHTGDGWYEAFVDYPSTFEGSIRWDSTTDLQARARTYISPSSSASIINTPPIIESDLQLAARVWRDGALPKETFNKGTEADAIRWVASTIIQGARDYVRNQIQSEIIPFSYPVPTSSIRNIYPDYTYVQIETIQSDWGTSSEEAVYYISLSRLYLLADALGEEYLVKSRALRDAADRTTQVLYRNILRFLNKTGANSGNTLRLVSIKLPKGRRRRNDYQ